MSVKKCREEMVQRVEPLSHHIVQSSSGDVYTTRALFLVSSGPRALFIGLLSSFHRALELFVYRRITVFSVYEPGGGATLFFGKKKNRLNTVQLTPVLYAR